MRIVVNPYISKQIAKITRYYTGYCARIFFFFVIYCKTTTVNSNRYKNTRKHSLKNWNKIQQASMRWKLAISVCIAENAPTVSNSEMAVKFQQRPLIKALIGFNFANAGATASNAPRKKKSRRATAFQRNCERSLLYVLDQLWLVSCIQLLDY